ncbi:MAG: S1 RNA-binding domain-containing protein [Candidatus Gottesmanbacteria bacterium]
MVKPKKSDKSDSTNSSLTKNQSSSGEPQTMEELLQATGYQLHGFKRGDTIDGTIISITPSEILIDIGYKSLGVVSEREMGQVGDLNLKVGDKIPVQIVSPESEAGQLILSIRRAGMDKKWQELKGFKDKNEPIEVMGGDMARGGILVDWQGIRGFLPISQLSTSRAGKPETVIGQKVKVLVLDVDKSTNRLVFSEKKVKGQAGTLADLSKLKIGQTYDGTVSGIVPFGIFVNIDIKDDKNTNLEGLVHISEIAWEKVTNPNDYFKAGQKVKVMVISTDSKTGKFNLSIKQLSTDPWQELAKKYTVDQGISGKVTKMSSFGAFVEIEKGLDGLIHISKIPASVELKDGEKVTCSIEGIDFQKRKISLALVLKEKPMGYR